MADKGKQKNNSQQPDEYYPTPANIPVGTRCLTIEIPDSAEWYGMAVGALWELMRIQNYEKVGLDIDLVVDRWLEVFRTMEVDCMDIIPVGATMTWHMAVAPERWIICEGGAVNVTEYPQLFALWGYKYGGAGAQFGVLDMRDVSPFGAEGGQLGLDDLAGEMDHTLTLEEMPEHSHRIRKANAAVTDVTINTVTANARAESLTTPIMLTHPEGENQGHNNLHPVRGVKWIVYGGRV